MNKNPFFTIKRLCAMLILFELGAPLLSDRPAKSTAGKLMKDNTTSNEKPAFPGQWLQPPKTT
jgi:hypothetical protein